MRLALFGPPGAGKGSQARNLVERRNLTHISTGVIIRSAMKAGTEVGEKARSYVEEGQLVPDHIVQVLAEDAIREVNFKDYVLDGFPRTIEQAEGLTDFLEQNKAPLDLVISLQVDDEVIIDRLSKRRVHKETGENYHLDHRPPPDDVPEDKIIQRPDDRPEKVKQRVEVYKQQTAPVEEYYAERGNFAAVDGDGNFEEVYERIEEAMENVIASQRT